MQFEIVIMNYKNNNIYNYIKYTPQPTRPELSSCTRVAWPVECEYPIYTQVRSLCKTQL